MDSDVSIDSFGYEEVLGKLGFKSQTLSFMRLIVGLREMSLETKQKRKESLLEGLGVKHLY